MGVLSHEKQEMVLSPPFQKLPMWSSCTALYNLLCTYWAVDVIQRAVLFLVRIRQRKMKYNILLMFPVKLMSTVINKLSFYGMWNWEKNEQGIRVTSNLFSSVLKSKSNTRPFLVQHSVADIEGIWEQK